MVRIASFFLAVLLAASLPAAMTRGDVLRMHVIPPDDTPAMQRVKLVLRDAVRATYAAEAPEGPMRSAAESILPQLKAAAQSAADSAGFTGEVRVSIAERTFTARRLGSLTIPAGTYPALIIELGEGQGQNWWGILDPGLAAFLARVFPEEGAEEATPVIDWSLEALLSAILGIPIGEGRST